MNEETINSIKRFNIYAEKEIKRLKEENTRLNNIIEEVASDILKELEKNHHLSYGVALSIRHKLLDYKELKEGKIDEKNN